MKVFDVKIGDYYLGKCTLIKGEKMPKLTKPKVKLIGTDGNAFAILGKVIIELRKAGFDEDYVKKYREEATSGDYDHLLQVTMKYVEIE